MQPVARRFARLGESSRTFLSRPVSRKARACFTRTSPACICASCNATRSRTFLHPLLRPATLIVREFDAEAASLRFFLIVRVYTPFGCQHTHARAMRFTRPPRDSSFADEKRHRFPKRAMKKGSTKLIMCGIQLLCFELAASSSECATCTPARHVGIR